MKLSCIKQQYGSLISIFTIMASIVNAENKLPEPSWLSKSPLAVKPASNWWLTMKDHGTEGNITRAIQEEETIDITELQKSVKPIKPDQKKQASFAVIVFDPWVPWEVDYNYLEQVHTLCNVAFFTREAFEQKYDTSEQLIIRRQHQNFEMRMLTTKDQNNEETTTAEYLTALQGAVYTGATQLFIPLLGQSLSLIGNAITSAPFKDLLKQCKIPVTLIYKANHKHRNATTDFSFFDQLIELSDEINHTHYHNARPIRYFIFSYLKWAYQYEEEQAAGEITAETEAALHHVAEQMNILLKKLV